MLNQFVSFVSLLIFLKSILVLPLCPLLRILVALNHLRTPLLLLMLLTILSLFQKSSCPGPPLSSHPLSLTDFHLIGLMMLISSLKRGRHLPLVPYTASLQQNVMLFLSTLLPTLSKVTFVALPPQLLPLSFSFARRLGNSISVLTFVASMPSQKRIITLSPSYLISLIGSKVVKFSLLLT